jgi:hypothetical protein
LKIGGIADGDGFYDPALTLGALNKTPCASVFAKSYGGTGKGTKKPETLITRITRIKNEN